MTDAIESASPETSEMAHLTADAAEEAQHDASVGTRRGPSIQEVTRIHQSVQSMRIVFTLWASGNKYWMEEERRRAVNRVDPGFTAEQMAVLKVAMKHFRLRRMYQTFKEWELIVFGVVSLQAKAKRRGSYNSEASDDSMFGKIPASDHRQRGQSRSKMVGAGTSSDWGFGSFVCCDGERRGGKPKGKTVPKPQRRGPMPQGGKPAKPGRPPRAGAAPGPGCRAQ